MNYVAWAIMAEVVACVMGGDDNRIFQPFQAIKNKTRVGNFDAAKVYQIFFEYMHYHISIDAELSFLLLCLAQNHDKTNGCKAVVYLR